MHNLKFSSQLPYGEPDAQTGVRSGVTTRAYVWFQIFNTSTGRVSRREFGLIDSGCDICLLDDDIRQSIGARQGKRVPISVAGGGTVTAYEAPTAAIEVEGMPAFANIPLLFLVGAAATPLIGRQVYLNAFDIAFTPSAWLHA